MLDQLDGALMAAAGRTALVDAATLAAELGVSREWVYEHRDELGAIPLGKGSRPRLRFDPDAARAALSCSGSERSQYPDLALESGQEGDRSTPRGSRRRSLAARRPEPGSILPIRPRRATRAS
jgi:hypothetical protein